jgi:hypothetical protein
LFALSVVALPIALALGMAPNAAEGGSLIRNTSKAAVERFWRAPARRAVAVKPAGAAAKATGEREAAALREQLRRLDDDTLGRIERRYGTHIAPERLGQARTTQTRFLEHEAYQDQLRRSYPALPPNRREGVLGNYVEDKIYVDRNQVRVPRVTAHERLHQLSDPRFRPLTGSRLDEGLTEHFARRIHGDLGLKDLSPIYPNEGRVAQMLEARVGEPLLARAYFRGETKALRQEIDRQLGAGTFDDMVRTLERRDYQGAEALLKSGK